MQDAIDMTEIKYKLTHLAEHMADEDPFLCAFAAELGERLNSKMVPEGFNTAAELLLADLRRGQSGFATRPLPASLTGQPPVVYAALNMSLERIAHAVCPTDFADAYVRVRAQVAELVAGVEKADYVGVRAQIAELVAGVDKAEEAKRPPSPPRRVLSADEETTLYAAARQIADIWFQSVQEEAATGSYINCQRRDDGVNGFYNHTDSGLFVEWYYGSPDKVWTPWGYWDFAGGMSHGNGAAQRAVERFMKRVELRIHEPVQHVEMGTIGPVYAVVAIDGKPVPEAKVAPRVSPAERSPFYTRCTATWTRLTQAYERAQRTS